MEEELRALLTHGDIPYVGERSSGELESTDAAAAGLADLSPPLSLVRS